jgi:hypothetical protein
MSLILDALRKAERERELGKVPTIGSQWPLLRRPAADRRGRWLAAIAAFAVSAAVVGAWTLRERWWAAEAPVASSAAGSSEAALRTAPEPGAGTSTIAAPVEAGAPVVTAPDPADEARRVAEQALAVAEAAKREAEKAAAAAMAPAPALPPVEAPPIGPADSMPAPAWPANAGIALEPDGQGEREMPPVAEAEKPVAEPPVSDPPPPPVPLAWELPLSVRQSLPALSIAMHVYADEPTRRFVILNDQRLVEGESAGAGVTVREIRRDGVVLEFQGQRFLMPRGGL